MSDKKRVYVGSGKKQNDTWIKATISPEKFKDYIEEFNGNKFIRLNINIKDAPDQYGKDVSISIDEWKPDPSNASNVGATTSPVDETSDLPF